MSATLYQTRGGAYFVHEARTKERWIERDREYVEKVDHTFQPLSPEEAQKWMMTGEVEVFHSPFEDPPEATAEPEPGATLYVRMPASLKSRIDEAARQQGLSANVWAMRCLERCVGASSQRAWDADLRQQHRESARSMLEEFGTKEMLAEFDQRFAPRKEGG